MVEVPQSVLPAVLRVWPRCAGIVLSIEVDNHLAVCAGTAAVPGSAGLVREA